MLSNIHHINSVVKKSQELRLFTVISRIYIHKGKLAREIGNEISKSRMETLTDGVFAIVMTLLVLEITVPYLSHSEVASELPNQLLELWPVVLSYVMSFILLGFFWIYHHDQFHYINRVNRILVWITIFYLMIIAFIPFSTSLLGGYGDQQISVVIYGINIAMAAFGAYVQWWYAARNHRLVDSDLDPSHKNNVTKRPCRPHNLSNCDWYFFHSISKVSSNEPRFYQDHFYSKWFQFICN
jgi:uncharacterized membrane protein